MVGKAASIIVGLLLLNLAFVGRVPGVAYGAHVACGDTIFANTVLDGNLTDCVGDGIIIGADAIKLMLNGYVIDGFAALPSGVSPGVGINVGSHKKVKIQGPGVVRQFTTGIRISGGGGKNKIEKVVVKHNKLGVDLSDSNDNLVKENTIYDADTSSGSGIRITCNSSCPTTGNSIEKNEIFDINGLDAVLLDNAHNSRIIENHIHDSTADYAIDVRGDDNTIQGNHIHDVSADCNIQVAIRGGSDRNDLNRNIITSRFTGTGVKVGTDTCGGADPGPTTNDSNVIHDNMIEMKGGTGVRIGNGNGNVIRENTFFDNTTNISDSGTNTVQQDDIFFP